MVQGVGPSTGSFHVKDESVFFFFWARKPGCKLLELARYMKGEKMPIVKDVYVYSVLTQ